MTRPAMRAAALLLVAAASCQQPPSDAPPGGTNEAAAPNHTAFTPTELPGFRADAWYLPEDALLGFVQIPAGDFLMGSDPAVDTLAFDNERWDAAHAQGTVDLPTFYIARYEVTVAQFSAFVRATGYRIDERALQAPAAHPVTWISWPDALAYCRWLDATLKQWLQAPEQLSEILHSDGWTVQLPSEAQWEKAARGIDGRIYPWGDAPDATRANYRGRATTPVGEFRCPECTFGLFDMSGNVWELTRSRYRPYPYDPTEELGDLQADALWVMRGGHFGDPEQNVRAAVRGGIDPGARRPFVGFRVVLGSEHRSE